MNVYRISEDSNVLELCNYFLPHQPQPQPQPFTGIETACLLRLGRQSQEDTHIASPCQERRLFFLQTISTLQTDRAQTQTQHVHPSSIIPNTQLLCMVSQPRAHNHLRSINSANWPNIKAKALSCRVSVLRNRSHPLIGRMEKAC